jgi:hypothetical protein
VCYALTVLRVDAAPYRPAGRPGQRRHH